MAVNISNAQLSGNPTKDPELRATPNGNSYCRMRVACNARKKDSYGEWVDKPMFFNVVAWGRQAELCAQNLKKGDPVVVDGRLDWREYEPESGGGKREVIDIVVREIVFANKLGSGGGGGNRAPDFDPDFDPPPADEPQQRFVPEADVPADDNDFAPPVGSSVADDDIPF